MAPIATRGSALEIWGGLECTINRVGDIYFNQLERNGHLYRQSDLDLFAELGIRTLRYPVLWEHIAPEGLESADWSWPDERLSGLRERNINPIIGLVHHGSGPRSTSLIDPAFPEKLADYAEAVASRYPWANRYTPVNEPLTTARFSGLYGHWYPHGQDDKTFLLALMHECKGTILAMKRIRQINPEAQLIQTEDLGKIYSTPKLAYQAELENERRWLSFDLLCGRINSQHRLWDYFIHAGINPTELAWFEENPCPPDILGINHYLTSDRFLDENLECYPSHFHGGNGKDAYADVEAVRVHPEDYAGHQTLLREAFDRYGLPVAVTEAHLGCTRDEQMRWLWEIWGAAEKLRAEGVDVRAVTVWSLLGAFDWNSLVTQDNGFYESGAYDLRGDSPRPTALTKMITHFATGKPYHHPILDIEGWWRRSDRLHYPKASVCNFGLVGTENCEVTQRCQHIQPLVIVGANGTLGKAFARICDIRGIPYYLLSRRDMDIHHFASVEETLRQLNPWAVVNAAGYVRVDDAESDAHICWLSNVVGPANLASVCQEMGIPLVTFSSDLVFNGESLKPYIESDPVSPLNVYGQTKVEAENRVLAISEKSLVIRTSAFFGPWDEYNFVTKSLQEVMLQRMLDVPSDMIVSPTYVPDLVNASLDLLIDGESGLWHLSNPSELSWADFATMAAKAHGLETRYIRPCTAQEISMAAIRPGYSVLGSERGILLPALEHALERYLSEASLKMPALAGRM